MTAQKKKRTYYVYTLARPATDKLPNDVFYVGKGTKSRLFEHEEEAARGKRSKKCDVIREIWSQGGQVQKTIVYSTYVERDALIYEWVLINLVYGPSVLTNKKFEKSVTFPRFKRPSSRFKMPRPRGTESCRLTDLIKLRKAISLPLQELARRSGVSGGTVERAEKGEKILRNTATQLLNGLNSALADFGRPSVTMDDLGIRV